MIEWSLKEEDIKWIMEWGKDFPDKPATEEVFEDDKALAHLLINGVVFINNGWWLKENWPKDAITIHVNCNDIFAWGCADSEDLLHDEIKDLYEHWRKDDCWGPAIWCIKKRQMRPQKPVEKAIREHGVWDLDTILVKKNG